MKLHHGKIVKLRSYHIITSKEILDAFKNNCLPLFNQENCKDAPVLIVTTFIKNRSDFERDGTASNELANGWGVMILVYIIKI